MIARVLIVLVAVALWPSLAVAECSGAGCTWQTTYVEPSLLTNGSAITDLVNCTATYTTAIDGGAQGNVKTFTIAASSPSGGGLITNNHTDATMVPSHVYVISESVACTSASLGTGAALGPAVLSMTNGAGGGPPAPPSGFHPLP